MSWFGIAATATQPDMDSGGDDRSPERIHLDIWPATSLLVRLADLRGRADPLGNRANPAEWEERIPGILIARG